MISSVKLAALVILLASAAPVFSQEEAPQTRREALLAAQKLLLEDHVFAPDEILSLINLRQEAELQGEAGLAVDFGILVFAARRTTESLEFASRAQEVMQVEWAEENRRRERESLKNFMNGSAAVVALLGGGSLVAGFGLHQLSSQAFAKYAASPVNSDEALLARADYRNYESYSYLCMVGAAALFTLSTRLMFLQN